MRTAIQTSIAVFLALVIWIETQKPVRTEARNEKQPDETRRLYEAVCAVESSGGTDPRAFIEKPTGELGVAQIKPCVLADIKQFLHKDYLLKDRLDPEKSYHIFNAYTGLWIKRRNLPDTFEYRARIWKEGPTNYTNNRASEYWQKVQLHLD